MQATIYALILIPVASPVARLAKPEMVLVVARDDGGFYQARSPMASACEGRVDPSTPPTRSRRLAPARPPVDPAAWLGDLARAAARRFVLSLSAHAGRWVAALVIQPLLTWLLTWL